MSESPIHHVPQLPQDSGDPNRARYFARGLILLAAVFWSLSGFFAKAPFLLAWPPHERGLLLGFWRTLFAGVALLIFVRRPVWTWRLVPACLAFAVMNGSFLLAMTNTTAANAIWLQYTAPAWVFVVGALWLREPFTRRDLWLLAMTMVGVAVILTSESLWGAPVVSTGDPRAGLLWGLTSGLGFAGVVLGLRRLRELPGTWVVAMCHLTAAASLFPFVLASSTTRPTVNNLAWFALFGILQMAVPYLLFTRALRSVSGHEAACITLLEPLLVPLWVFLAWRDAADYAPPAWWTWLGGGIILLGLLQRYVWINPWGGKQRKGMVSEA